MEKSLFDDLVQSLKEAKAIAHGECDCLASIQGHNTGCQGGT